MMIWWIDGQLAIHSYIVYTVFVFSWCNVCLIFNRKQVLELALIEHAYCLSECPIRWHLYRRDDDGRLGNLLMLPSHILILSYHILILSYHTRHCRRLSRSWLSVVHAGSLSFLLQLFCLIVVFCFSSSFGGRPWTVARHSFAVTFMYLSKSQLIRSHVPAHTPMADTKLTRRRISQFWSWYCYKNLVLWDRRS